MNRPQPIPPGPGQESVWDYPRPPRVEPTDEHVVVVLGGVTILQTRDAVRVLETSHPPTYYLPLRDAVQGAFVPTAGVSWCEFKGRASYFDVIAGDRVEAAAAWTYPAPHPDFRMLAGLVAIYPGRMDSVSVNGEPVVPQPGGFYGGWITSRVVGPFKGGPGTRLW